MSDVALTDPRLLRRAPPAAFRPEVDCALAPVDSAGAVERNLSPFEKLANLEWLRRGLILFAIAAAWQVYATYLDDPLLLPTFGETMRALWEATVSGALPPRIWGSLQVLLLGYAIGVILAGALTSFAVSSRLGSDLLSTLTSMFNPLPAIALLPLAMLWFGLGIPSLVFVIVHSVLWPVALNTQTGFLGVPETLRMAGRNCGLKGFSYVWRILVPAAFPSILAGLKIGWAFAWRTLIAAELVFGVASRSGGLGWFIFEHRNELQTDYVFAGLMTVILIGLFVEEVIFRTIAHLTVQRWGAQR
ncbi:ABC transporter permease [Xanthobacter pseudotagetidis]|uniref:ABC transporter permease n=1 Tax=Xanthobacter pseudotagetidis TaxID=3119911 RepID=UPI003727D9DE